jgi:hypothetical protein
MIRGAERGCETGDETPKADPVVSPLMPRIPRKQQQTKDPPSWSPTKPQPRTSSRDKVEKEFSAKCLRMSA